MMQILKNIKNNIKLLLFSNFTENPNQIHDSKNDKNTTSVDDLVLDAGMDSIGGVRYDNKELNVIKKRYEDEKNSLSLNIQTKVENLIRKVENQNILGKIRANLPKNIPGFKFFVKKHEGKYKIFLKKDGENFSRVLTISFIKSNGKYTNSRSTNISKLSSSEDIEKAIYTHFFRRGVGLPKMKPYVNVIKTSKFTKDKIFRNGGYIKRAIEIKKQKLLSRSVSDFIVNNPSLSISSTGKVVSYDSPNGHIFRFYVSGNPKMSKYIGKDYTNKAAMSTVRGAKSLRQWMKACDEKFRIPEPVAFSKYKSLNLVNEGNFDYRKLKKINEAYKLDELIFNDKEKTGFKKLLLENLSKQIVDSFSRLIKNPKNYMEGYTPEFRIKQDLFKIKSMRKYPDQIEFYALFDTHTKYKKYNKSSKSIGEFSTDVFLNRSLGLLMQMGIRRDDFLKKLNKQLNVKLKEKIDRSNRIYN